MTSCPPNPHQRSHRFRSAVEVVEGLARPAQSALEDPRAMLVPPDLLGLRAMLVNADLSDQKALEVFRVLLDLLVAELEEPLFLVPKDLEDLLVPLDLKENKESRVLLDLRVIMVFPALPDLLVPPEQMVNLDPKARMDLLVPLDLPDPKVLLDLQESVVPLVRMQSPLSSTGISPRTRRPRPTARRLMLKTHSDRPIRSRTAHGTTLR